MPVGFKHRSHEQVLREREAGAKLCVRCEEIRPLSEFHVAARTRDGLQSWCKACYREVRRERYSANREHELERNRRWATAHPSPLKTRPTELRSEPARAKRPNLPDEEIRRRKAERHRLWREKNKDLLRDKWRAWEQSRRDLTVARTNRRRARVLQAIGEATADQIQARIALFGGRCWVCGDVATAVDHVIPLSRGGSNWPANLRPICKSCNSRKYDRMPKEVVISRASFF